MAPGQSTNEPAVEPVKPLSEPEHKAILHVGSSDGRSIESLLVRISGAKRKFKIPRQD